MCSDPSLEHIVRDVCQTYMPIFAKIVQDIHLKGEMKQNKVDFPNILPKKIYSGKRLGNYNAPW